MIKVIIFDLDGLLVDSQPLQYRIYNQIFSRYGFPITIKEWQNDWIHNSMNCRQWVEKKHLPLDFAKIRAEKTKLYEQLIITDLELKSGANHAIDALKDKYRLCIASASMRSSLDAVAHKFGFVARFQKIISDQEAHIERPKPHPDVFLHAAEEMGVLPRNCLVIEDSIAGLRAAKSANMTCIICPDSFCQVDSREFKDADKIVGSLNEIDIQLIQRLDHCRKVSSG